MNANQQKNYEEAAKAYSRADIFPHHVHQASYRAFLAGCAHASKEARSKVINDVIELLAPSVAFGWLERDWINLKTDLEKLKL